MVSIKTSKLVMIGCLVLCADAVRAFDNSSSRYLFMEEEQLMKGRVLGARKPRFLSFQTIDNDISVEMQLSVPFLTIPVKKTMDSASGFMGKFPTANLNVAAIGLGAAVVASSAFVVPSLLRLISADHLHTGWAGQARSDGMSPLVQLERALGEHGMPAGACTQRAVCTLVKKATEATTPNSSDKIVDGLASNDWVLGILQGTSLSEAITAGYGGENCSVKYPQCKISQTALQNMAKMFSSKIFSD